LQNMALTVGGDRSAPTAAIERYPGSDAKRRMGE
jgi:hypothetical protein